MNLTEQEKDAMALLRDAKEAGMQFSAMQLTMHLNRNNTLSLLLGLKRKGLALDRTTGRRVMWYAKHRSGR